MSDMALKKLSEISNIVMGQSPSSNYVFDDLEHGLPFLQGCAEFDKKFPIPLKSCSNGPKKANKGSTLISVRAPVGDTNVADKDFIIGRGLASIEAKGVEADYLPFAINFSKGNLQRVSQGSTFAAIGSKELQDLHIPIFERSEQQKIAQILATIDGQIEATEKLIEKKTLLKNGYAYEELFENNNGHLYRLGDLVTFHKGKGLPKSEIVFNGKYGCIHYGELFTTYSEVINKIMSFTDEINTAFFSKAGDVLMPTSDVTPYGLATGSCINEDGVVLGGDILVIRPNLKILNGTFLSFYINNSRNQILRMIAGSTVYHLYASTMQNFKIVVPDLVRQSNIVSLMNSINEELQKLKIELKKFECIKNGLMQDLLTGRVRVN